MFGFWTKQEIQLMCFFCLILNACFTNQRSWFPYQLLRPLREGKRLLRPQAHRQEKDPREEVHAEPGLQRVLHLRHPARAATWDLRGVPGGRLRPDHQERGSGPPAAGPPQPRPLRSLPLEGGLRKPPPADLQMAQPEWVLREDHHKTSWHHRPVGTPPVTTTGK